MIIVRRVCQVCCIRSCCCCCCNLLQNAITKRYQQRLRLRLRLRQEQLHIFELRLQLGVITVRVTLGLMLMPSEQIAASAQLFSRFTCSAGGGWCKRQLQRGRGEGKSQFSYMFTVCSAFNLAAFWHNTLAKKKPSKERQKERKSEGETEKEK